MDVSVVVGRRKAITVLPAMNSYGASVAFLCPGSHLRIRFSLQRRLGYNAMISRVIQYV